MWGENCSHAHGPGLGADFGLRCLAAAMAQVCLGSVPITLGRERRPIGRGLAAFLLRPSTTLNAIVGPPDVLLWVGISVPSGLHVAGGWAWTIFPSPDLSSRPGISWPGNISRPGLMFKVWEIIPGVKIFPGPEIFSRPGQ